MALQLQRLFHRHVRLLGGLNYSSSLPFLKPISPVLCLSFHSEPSVSQSVSCPKPSEIPWPKELSNTVQLIGTVGCPVEFKTTTSGKACAWTRLSVPKSASSTSGFSLIGLSFWDELAHVAHQHVEKGNLIYVSGRLIVDTDADKQQAHYKVVVQELNFTSPNNETNYVTKERTSAVSANDDETAVRELWQDLFANPSEWWDKRKNKRNPRFPDFRRKDFGPALWVGAKNTPLWVQSQLVQPESPVVSRPKPSEIPWAKELSNTVQLIGSVGSPVELKTTTSGKTLAWTRLSVPKSTSTFGRSLILLVFWGELAHVAHQHVEKGNRIYVSGRFVVDTDADKQQTHYKVVVQKLNFMSPNNEPDYVTKESTSAVYANNYETSVQERWQAFFANPSEWWDNRKNKINPMSPDFKHKDTGEALWVGGKNTPHWVQSQLERLDSRMEPFRANEANRRCSFIAFDDLRL